MRVLKHHRTFEVALHQAGRGAPGAATATGNTAAVEGGTIPGCTASGTRCRAVKQSAEYERTELYVTSFPKVSFLHR